MSTEIAHPGEPLTPAALPELPAMAGLNEAMLAEIESAVELAPRWNAAIMKIIASCTYSEDWVPMDGKACLTSAGAERIMSRIGGFEIREHRPPERMEINDSKGKGYGWTYTFDMTWRDRRIVSEGTYTTRHAFLGKAHGEFRDVAEINEADIRAAARHVSIAQGIKQLLGIRHIPLSQMPELGKAPTGGYTHGKTAVGKTDKEKQAAIREMLLELNDGDPDAAEAQFLEIASFKGKDGEMVAPKSTSALTGKWLNTVYGKVKEMYEKKN